MERRNDYMRQVDLTGRQRQCGIDAECRISSEVGPLGRSPSGTGDASSQRAVPYSAEALCSVLTRHVSWLSVSKGCPTWGAPSLRSPPPSQCSFCTSGLIWRVLLTDYSGATAADSHRFPVGCDPVTRVKVRNAYRLRSTSRVCWDVCVNNNTSKRLRGWTSAMSSWFSSETGEHRPRESEVGGIVDWGHFEVVANL